MRSYSIYTVIFYSQSVAVGKGISVNITSYLLAMLNAASLFGRLIPNYAADTVGTLNILIAACGVAAVSAVLLVLHMLI